MQLSRSSADEPVDQPTRSPDNLARSRGSVTSSDYPEAKRPKIFVQFRDCVVFDCFQPQVGHRKRAAFSVETFTRCGVSSERTNAPMNTSLQRCAPDAQQL